MGVGVQAGLGRPLESTMFTFAIGGIGYRDSIPENL